MGVPAWPRRRARAGVLLAASGCFSSAAAGSCDPLPNGANGALGHGRFTYDCTVTQGGVNEADAWCQTAADPTVIPDVATSAPFRIAFNQDSTGGPQPAVPSLAPSTSQGWSFPRAGWLGFLAYSGSDVVDFTHVRALEVASLRWQEALPAELRAGGAPSVLAVVPLAAAGATLGGVISCMFAASDPAVLGIVGGGRFATVSGLAAGDATLTASCMGVQLRAALHVRTGAPIAMTEAGQDDAPSDDTSPGDASAENPGEGAGEVSDAASIDAGGG